jgi:hypothetical protein
LSLGTHANFAYGSQARFLGILAVTFAKMVLPIKLFTHPPDPERVEFLHFLLRCEASMPSSKLKALEISKDVLF